jgi:hypothetical protein
MQLLKECQRLAEEYGAPDMFRESYTKARELNNVRQSLYLAMLQQDLLSYFDESVFED